MPESAITSVCPITMSVTACHSVIKAHEDTELTVIVYKYWGIDETIRKIETEHNKINGTPTTLEINLYYSAWLIRYGEKPFKTVVFEYD